jgi:hypothetical protein
MQPVGQMSLFEPSITHHQVWKHCASGEIVDTPLRPFRPALTVGKQMAVATVEPIFRGCLGKNGIYSDFAFWRNGMSV